MTSIRHFMTIVESAATIAAYHGTSHRLSLPFRPLTHFGSLKAAQDRLSAVRIDGEKAARRLRSKRPISAWHMTSLQDKARRAEGPPAIYRVSLDVRNPARIKDAAVQHSPRLLAFALKDAKVFTQDEMLTVSLTNDSDQTEKLIELLRGKGHDGIVYQNRYEDRGSDSYVILDPAQVIRIEKLSAETLQETSAEGRMTVDDLPEEVQSFISELAPDDVGREIVEDWIIRFEGFSDLCVADAEERCLLPPDDPRHLARLQDVHSEVSAQWEREEKRVAIASGFAGSDENPVQWAVFKP